MVSPPSNAAYSRPSFLERVGSGIDGIILMRLCRLFLLHLFLQLMMVLLLVLLVIAVLMLTIRSIY